VLVFTFFGAVDYIGNGRFQRIAFLRRERVTKRLLFLAKSIVTYLDNYRYKAEADRVYVTRRRVLRVIAFYFVSVLLFAIIIAVRCIAVLFTIIFKGLIILAGLQIKLPYIEKIDHLLRELGNLLHLDFLYFYLLYPFSLLMQALAWIQIEVVTFNVTCTGATAPLKLFFNVIIMGLIMIMTQSEYQLFSAISQTSLSNKFSFVITTPSYRNKTLYPPRNQWEALKRKAGFSMEYIRVLLVTLVSILSERFDFLRTLMQFVVSFVNLSDFVRANGYMHEYDASCNAVKGFEDFDKYLALIASVFAWIIFFPALYEVSNILIPGTIPGMPVVKTSNQDSIGKNFKKDGYVRKVYSGFRGLWRSTSVYAVDLWWAEGFKKWLNFMCTHSPYEINVPAPMLARARDLSFEATTREDDHLFNPDLIRSNTGVSVLEKTDHEVTTKLSISMLAPHSGEEWNRIIDDAENNDSVGGGAENGTSIVNSTKSDHHTLDEIAVFKGIMVRNKKANKVMEVLEMPVLPTFRVALGRDDVDASSVPEDAGIPAVFADAISDALAMSRDKAIFFTCKRALIDSYRWSIVPGVQTKSASFRGSGACFTLIRILGSTGEVDFSGIFDFSLPYEYPGGPEAMMHALNDSTSGHVIVLYTHGFIYPLELDPTNANNEGKTDFDWAEVRAQEAASIKEKLVSSASKNRLGEVGVARHAMEQQEMIEAIERCGGNADILSKATAYVLIGVPECGKSQGHQCFCTIDDKERTIYCSTRGQPKVSMGSALLGPDSKISELLVDVQFSIMNGQSVNFPLDWEILNSPYVQEKQLMCFKSDSFITSPLHTASEQENRKWLLRIKNDLPSYFSILKMEYMEMSSAGMWAVQLVIPAGLFTDLVVLPLANLISFIFAVFCLGHVFTYVGRRVWYMVGWKYLHFCLLCFGVWTETLVQMMKVHEFANIYSLILSHPSVKIKDLYKKAGIDWKETGVRGATLNDWSKGQAESEDGDDDGGSLKSEGQPRTTTTSEPVYAFDSNGWESEIVDENGVEMTAVEDEEVGGGGGGHKQSTPTPRKSRMSSIVNSMYTSNPMHAGRKSSFTGSNKSKEKEEDGEKSAEIHLASIEAADITSPLSYEEMPLESLRQAFRLEYGNCLMAIMATRAILVQIIPGLSLLSVMTEFTAKAPMLVYSKTLRDRLPDLIVRDCFSIARAMEKEFVDTVEHIRNNELQGNDHCFVNPEYYEDPKTGNKVLVPPQVRKQVLKENKYLTGRMGRAMNITKKNKLQVYEWRVKVTGCMVFIRNSRLIEFVARASMFVLILVTVFGDESLHPYVVVSTIIVAIPQAIVPSLEIVNAVGFMLSITDRDLSFTYRFFSILFTYIFSCGRVPFDVAEDIGNDATEEDDIDHDELYDHALSITTDREPMRARPVHTGLALKSNSISSISSMAGGRETMVGRKKRHFGSGTDMTMIGENPMLVAAAEDYTERGSNLSAMSIDGRPRRSTAGGIMNRDSNFIGGPESDLGVDYVDKDDDDDDHDGDEEEPSIVGGGGGGSTKGNSKNFLRFASISAASSSSNLLGKASTSRRKTSRSGISGGAGRGQGGGIMGRKSSFETISRRASAESISEVGEKENDDDGDKEEERGDDKKESSNAPPAPPPSSSRARNHSVSFVPGSVAAPKGDARSAARALFQAEKAPGGDDDDDGDDDNAADDAIPNILDASFEDIE
jgi:hypothetical protein